MALHFPVTGSLFGQGGITFADGLVIPSSGELALLSSPPHWECSAPLQLHGNTMVTALVNSDAQKKGLWDWMKLLCFWLPGPFLWAFSKAKVGFYCLSLAAALTFPMAMATSWGDRWLISAGTVISCLRTQWSEHSGLSCVRVCVSLGIRAALMSALVHLKAAQDDFMQSPQRCLHKKRCFRNVNSVWGQIFLCWSLLIQDEVVKM